MTTLQLAVQQSSIQDRLDARRASRFVAQFKLDMLSASIAQRNEIQYVTQEVLDRVSSQIKTREQEEHDILCAKEQRYFLQQELFERVAIRMEAVRQNKIQLANDSRFLPKASPIKFLAKGHQPSGTQVFDSMDAQMPETNFLETAYLQDHSGVVYNDGEVSYLVFNYEGKELVLPIETPQDTPLAYMEAVDCVFSGKVDVLETPHQRTYQFKTVMVLDEIEF